MTVAVAVIGYGLAGRVFHAPLIAGAPGLRLAAIVSRQKEAVRADYPGTAVPTLEEMLGDPAISVVVVATPNDSHLDLASRALAAGKHVVVDKPFALTSAEARQLIARAEAAGRMLSVFHNRRWDSDFLTLQRLIADGSLGEITFFESHFDRFRPQVTDRWRDAAGPATGIWYDLGSHLADQALQLFGAPQAVFADLGARRSGARTTDYFRVLLRYPKLRVVLTGNALAPADELRLRVHGTRSSYIKHGLDPQEPFVRGGGRPDDPRFGVDPRPGVLLLSDGSSQPVPAERGDYRQYYAGLRDAVLGRGPLPVTVNQALAVMQLLEAGEASAAQRREIPFSP